MNGLAFSMLLSSPLQICSFSPYFPLIQILHSSSFSHYNCSWMQQAVARRERTIKIRILACPVMPWLWLLDQGKNYPFKIHHLQASLSLDKERKIFFSYTWWQRSKWVISPCCPSPNIRLGEKISHFQNPVLQGKTPGTKQPHWHKHNMIYYHSVGKTCSV